MESQQTVIIPNDAILSADGRNFMLSLPLEQNVNNVINVPVIFTTDNTDNTIEAISHHVDGTENTDKNSFFLDSNQLTFLTTSSGEHIILTTEQNTNDNNGTVIKSGVQDQQILFTPVNSEETTTTYITNVLLPDTGNAQDNQQIVHLGSVLRAIDSSVLTANDPDSNNIVITATPIASTSNNNLSVREEEILPPVRKGPFLCEICRAVFKTWPSYRKHQVQHKYDKPYRCNECLTTFNLEINLKLHMKTHQTRPPWHCDECNRTFNRLASLKAHNLIHEREENLFCEECGEECVSQAHLTEHKAIDHDEKTPQVFHCRFCSKDFNSKIDVKNHHEEHVKRNNLIKVANQRKKLAMRGAGPHICQVCSKGFLKISLLKRHMVKHSGEKPFSCEECGQRFTQKGSLVIHNYKHKSLRPYKCELCPSTFTQRGNLRTHLSRVHPEPVSGQNFYKCQYCPCAYKKIGSLNSHIGRYHTEEASLQKIVDANNKDNATEQDPSTNQNVDDCDILQAAINKSGLQQQRKQQKTVPPDGWVAQVMLADSQADGRTKHFCVKMRISGGIRWHQCVYCPKEFKKPSDLIRHMRTHTNERPFSCNICSKAFSVKSSLVTHIKTHTHEKTHQCEYCFKTYSSTSSLTVHKRMHYDLKPYSCNDCGKKFRTIGNKNAHQCLAARAECIARRKQKIQERRDMKEQLKDGTIPFLQDPLVVTESGIAVVSKKRGSAPQSSEDGQSRPYVCAECGSRYKKNSHLKQHELTHKGIKRFSCNICHKKFITSGVLKAHHLTHQKLKNYKCEECGSEYTTKGSLKRHVATHSSQKPYFCPYCQKDFKSSANCRKHIRTHAKEVLSGLVDPNEALPDVIKRIDAVRAAKNAIEASSQNIQQPKASTSTNTTELPQQSVIISTATVMNRNINENLGQMTTKIETLENTRNQEIIHSVSPMRSPTLPSISLQQPPPNEPTLQQSHGSEIYLDLIQTTQTTSNTTLTFPESTMMQSKDTSGDVEFPSLLSEQPNNSTTTGDIPVYFKGLDGQTYDTTLYISGIPIQSLGNPLETNFLSNMLNSSTSDDALRSISCDKCHQEFLSLESLNLHSIEEHNHICQFCDQQFDNAEFLSQHIEAIHDKNEIKKKLECTICNFEFRSMRLLNNHNNKVHKDGNKSQEIEIPTMENEMRTVIVQPIRKKHSKAVVVSEEEVAKALEQAKNHEPSLSEKIFLAGVQERQHQSECIATEPEVNIVIQHANVCTWCPKSFKKPSDLARHVRIHTGERPYSCELCGKTFTVKSTLLAHKQLHYKDDSAGLPCHLCGSKFATKGSLKVHMRIHTGVRPLKCQHCDVSFRTSGHRKAHILAVHAPKKTKKATNKSKQPKAVVAEPSAVATSCIVENTEVIANREQQNVQETEPMETNPELQLLPLESTELIQLDENLLQQLQSGQLILQSSDGDGNFRLELFSDYGQPTIITSEIPVEYEAPKETEVQVSPNKERTCNTCGKHFAKPSLLVRHLRIHNGEKPYECLICSKRFNQKNSLDLHLLLHSGEKPHQCDLCNKSFTQAGNLKTHMRRAHQNVFADLESSI